LALKPFRGRLVAAQALSASLTTALATSNHRQTETEHYG
jgi:hypothetical protein